MGKWQLQAGSGSTGCVACLPKGTATPQTAPSGLAAGLCGSRILLEGSWASSTEPLLPHLTTILMG